MNQVETAKALLAAFEANDAQTEGQYLTDDFTFSGPVPVPLDKSQFLHLLTALVSGVPDWHFNVQGIQEIGNQVVVTVRISGTQTGTLEHVIPGVAPVPPTGKSFAIPEERITATFRGDKIASMSVNSVPGGGVPGLYAQIGHPLPVPPGAPRTSGSQE